MEILGRSYANMQASFLFPRTLIKLILHAQMKGSEHFYAQMAKFIMRNEKFYEIKMHQQSSIPENQTMVCFPLMLKTTFKFHW